MKLKEVLPAIGLIALAGCSSPLGGYSDGIDHGKAFWLQLTTYVLAALVGLGIGYALSEKYKALRRQILRWLAVAVVVLSLFLPDQLLPVRGFLAAVITVVLFFAAWGIGLALGKIRRGSRQSKPRTFGSAQWMTAEGLDASPLELVGKKGLVLGYFEDGVTPLQYKGDRHLMTVAPTRAGKGVAAIIPNLLTYAGSALVIDPKGENAMITAMRRGAGDGQIPGMGQAVHVVDPWGITGLPSARFNPMDWLTPDSPELAENALMLADALVVSTPGNQNPFWDEEAKGLIMGLVLWVATAEEEGKRNLGQVRDLLTADPDALDALCVQMAASSNAVVASAGRRMAGKHADLLSSILTTAQSHTHFLDSPGLRDSLSRSDFRFEDLKTKPMTVYLVLPADRLHTFGRWLRLLIQQAITVTARNIKTKPERPILFMLDEMAALGRLAMVQQAFGLMAGFGMQMWAIVQDLTQLEAIYGEGWQTFVANSGVLQYFGSRDKQTAEYFSDLCGSETVKTLTSSFTATVSGGGGSQSTGHSHGEAVRKLIMPDELMRLRDDVQLLLVENAHPIDARKRLWMRDPQLKPLGIDLQKEQRATA